MSRPSEETMRGVAGAVGCSLRLRGGKALLLSLFSYLVCSNWHHHQLVRNQRFHWSSREQRATRDRVRVERGPVSRTPWAFSLWR